MKKILLSLLCIFVAILMVGCSSSSDAKALKELENQLAKTESVVSSTSTSEVSEVSPKLNYSSEENQINNLRNRAYNDMLLEENLRQDVLSLSAYLKDSQINNKYKLAKKAAASLNELTNNLEKYTNYLHDTKGDVKSSVKRIKKYTSVNSVSPSQAISGYTSLANTMMERNAYMHNILVTLEEITNLLNNNITKQSNQNNNQINQGQTGNYSNYNYDYKPNYLGQNSNIENENNLINNNNFDYNTNNQNNNLTNYNGINKNNSQTNNQNDEIDTKKHKPFIKKNIDSYNPYSKENLTDKNQNIDNTTSENNIKNDGYNYMPNPKSGNYNYRYNRINPNRNTDSYRAYFSNIDTYRYFPNRYNRNLTTPVSCNKEDKQEENQSKSENNKNQVIQTLPLKDEEKMKEDNRKEINKNLESDSSLTFNLLKQFHKGRKIDDKKDIEDKFGHMKEIVIFYNLNQ